MKILLAAINAKYIHSNPALLSLKAYAGKYADHILIREYTINQHEEEILADLYRARADVLAFSCYIWNIGMAERLAAAMHAIRPELPIWFGGPEVSFDAAECLTKNPALTGIIPGEGEKTFRDLAAYYIEGKPDLREIRGLICREDGRIMDQGDRMPLDLDELPFIYEDMADFEHKIVYYETSRGCPFSCSYCLSSVSGRVRLRSLPLVFKELQFFIDRKVPLVKFVDRTFNCNKAHARAIWRYIKDHDQGATGFHFEIGADLLEEEDLEILSGMRPGLVQLEIGVQSTCPETIREVSRTMDLEKLKRNVLAVKAGRNILQHLDLIAGLPYEDLERFKISFNEVYALEPDELQLGFLKVLKGSHMAKMAAEYGIVYRAQAPYEVMKTNWMSYDDILELKGVEEMLEIYSNSHQFELSLKYLQHWFDTPYDLFLALAHFYQASGLMTMQQSRIRRYEILLSFAASLEGRLNDAGAAADPHLMRALLIEDLYTREKLKSRPVWQPVSAADEEAVRAFFKNRENIEGYLSDYLKAGFTPAQIRRMVHIEITPFDTEKSAAEGRREGGRQMLLYDYRKKDPLTGSARKLCIDQGEDHD